MFAPETTDRKLTALRHALGPVVSAALADPKVVEVMVNADGAIWIETVGEGRRRDATRIAPADAERILRLAADQAGAIVGREHPLVTATLPGGGERFQGVCAPVTAAPCFSIRKPATAVFTLDDYVIQGMMSEEQAEVLRAAATARDNILIAGGAGCGKTTLANAMLALPAFKRDRVILIEDTAELQCSAADHLALLSQPGDPGVTMAMLVRAALRLRPDRIVVGEVRDGSALDVLKAWNTGHPGGLATLHANGAEEALSRLEDLVGEVSAKTPRRAIGQAVDLIAHLRRTPCGRRLDTLTRVTGWAEGHYRLQALPNPA